MSLSCLWQCCCLRLVSLSYLWQCCCLRWWCPCGVPVISVAVLLSETGVPVVSLSYLWQCCCLRLVSLWCPCHICGSAAVRPLSLWCPCGVPVISVAVLLSEVVVSLSYRWQCCCLRWWCPCHICGSAAV